LETEAKSAESPVVVVVPGAGIEPALCCQNRILRPVMPNINAVGNGWVGRRIGRRAAGKLAGRGLGRLVK